jgi:hypothetical protein
VKSPSTLIDPLLLIVILVAILIVLGFKNRASWSIIGLIGQSNSFVFGYSLFFLLSLKQIAQNSVFTSKFTATY